MVFRDKTPDGTTRLTGGAGESGGSNWNDILDKPSTFPPSAHTHSIGAVTGLQDELDDLNDTGITIYNWLTHLVDVGDYLLPKGFSTSHVYNPTSGLATFSKIIVERHSTYSHIGYYTTTAAVGGSVSLQFALYGSNSEGSKPNTSTRLGLTLVDDMTIGANRELAFASPVSLEPGVYWVGSLYRVLSTPTTSPQMRGADIVASDVSNPGIFWFNQTVPARCRELLGQTELPNAATTPTWSYSAIPPFVGLKRSG